MANAPDIGSPPQPGAAPPKGLFLDWEADDGYLIRAQFLNGQLAAVGVTPSGHTRR
jgi:hypothetical protein